MIATFLVGGFFVLNTGTVLADSTPSYTVTVTQTANGTISPDTQTGITSGTSESFTITPNSGYKTSNVSVDGSSVGAVTSYGFPGVFSDHTITASFSASSETLAFDSVGGSAVTSITAPYGSTITAPEAPTKAGYTFVAWSPVVPPTMPLGGTSLTATWAPIDYTITFNSDGGTSVADMTAPYGSTITAPEAPTKAGYTFAGWTPEVPTTMPLSETLTAQWTANPVVYGGGGGGGSSYIAPSTIIYRVIPGCDARTTGFSVTTGQSCIGNTGTDSTGSTIGQVLGAQSFHFTLKLQKGSTGNEVTELQKFLNAAGYDCGTVDGKFGAKTKSAVIKFEFANGLKGDGVVGPKVRAILNK